MTSNATRHEMRAMSVRDFTLWGMEDVAFVKRVTVNDAEAWVICSADGSQVGFAPSRDLAFAAVRQHDLEPYSVH